jgi:hypothetical protein
MFMEINKKDSLPIFDKEKRQKNHYGRHWAIALGLTTLAVLGIKQEIQNDNPSLPKNTMEHTVEPNQTVWGIASGESQKVADNPELLFQQEQQIENQIPKNQNGNLMPGETIYLPAHSADAVPIANSSNSNK